MNIRQMIKNSISNFASALLPPLFQCRILFQLKWLSRLEHTKKTTHRVAKRFHHLPDRRPLTSHLLDFLTLSTVGEHFTTKQGVSKLSFKQDLGYRIWQSWIHIWIRQCIMQFIEDNRYFRRHKVVNHWSMSDAQAHSQAQFTYRYSFISYRWIGLMFSSSLKGPFFVWPSIIHWTHIC